MGRIYILSTPDLPNHTVIYTSKKNIRLQEIVDDLELDNLEIYYEADFNQFEVGEYKGYLGFDGVTNDLLSLDKPSPSVGYLKSVFSEHTTNISPYIFKGKVDDVALKIAKDFHEDYFVSSKLHIKVKRFIERELKNSQTMYLWEYSLKERAKSALLLLDEFWVGFVLDTEPRIKDFFNKNPYKRLNKPSGLNGLIWKVNKSSQDDFRQLERAHWDLHVNKCHNYFASLLPDDDELSQVSLPCLWCRHEGLVYQLHFNDFRNDVIIDGTELPDISTKIYLLSSDCPNCDRSSSMAVPIKTHMFPKSNLGRWISIWWLRFRFWGKY